jgi:hypothetical protein
MAFHRGNAFLTNVTADNLRTTWTAWNPSLNDQYSNIVVDPLTHARFFNTKNLVVVSLHITVRFTNITPSPYTLLAVNLPATLRIKSNTHFKNQCNIERFTGTNERKFSFGMIIADGTTKGGIDDDTFLYLDRLFIQNLGQYIPDQTYTIRGQIVFEPS